MVNYNYKIFNSGRTVNTAGNLNKDNDCVVSEIAKQDSCFDSRAASIEQLLRQDSCFDSSAASTRQLLRAQLL